MNRRILGRLLVVAGATLASIVLLLPTFYSGLSDTWAGRLPAGPIRLGLDLQGGMHLVLEVDTDKAVEFGVERTSEAMKREMREERVPFVSATALEGYRIVVRAPSGNDGQGIVDLIEERFGTLEVTNRDGEVITYRPLTEEIARIREFAVEQSLETIRNRVDQLGLSEPIIQRSGTESILVQLPGETDPDRAKSIIGKTAVLQFKLVPEDKTIVQVLGTDPDPCTMREPDRGRALVRLSERAGPKLEVLCSREVDFGGQPFSQASLVERKTLMTGDVITNARPRPDTQVPGNYLVGLDFNSIGGALFEEITGRNVNRQLAIILDNTLYSAPRIQDKISGGRAVITGNFALRESRDLSIVLRAGALPAPVRIAEERTVGPSLGRDSIRQGTASFAIGGVLVLLTMLFYYRGAGVLANAALLLNVVFVLACLAGFGATLTLPGIAGLVLTLGMAVDANVLINERIREELRTGKTVRLAVESGYERALPAIMDSNFTTFLSGVILFQFGSGPIRGFAVTLCIGIATTIFTAVFCTRTIYDYFLQVRRIKELSI